jgi:hypothetical protein
MLEGVRSARNIPITNPSYLPKDTSASAVPLASFQGGLEQIYGAVVMSSPVEEALWLLDHDRVHIRAKLYVTAHRTAAPVLPKHDYLSLTDAEGLLDMCMCKLRLTQRSSARFPPWYKEKMHSTSLKR